MTPYGVHVRPHNGVRKEQSSQDWNLKKVEGQSTTPNCRMPNTDARPRRILLCPLHFARAQRLDPASIPIPSLLCPFHAQRHEWLVQPDRLEPAQRGECPRGESYGISNNLTRLAPLLLLYCHSFLESHVFHSLSTLDTLDVLTSPVRLSRFSRPFIFCPIKHLCPRKQHCRCRFRSIVPLRRPPPGGDQRPHGDPRRYRRVCRHVKWRNSMHDE